MLETIEADADRVTRLITELLDVSRIDSGRLQIRPLPLDVAAVYARHVERAVASGQERDRFAIDVPEDLPEVWADPDRLDQILSNLIENAFRHGDGVVTLAAQPATADGQEALESKGHSATGVDLRRQRRGQGHRRRPPASWCSAGSGTVGAREHRAWASTSSRGSSRPTVGGPGRGGTQRWRPVPAEPAVRAPRLPRLSSALART